MNKGNSRIIFCCNVPFPNGNAGAVRVFYVAKALMEAGRNVLVIAHGNGHDNGDSQMKEYRGVRYTTYDESRKAVFRFLNTRIFGGVHCVRKLHRLNLSLNDIVYIYANNSSFVYPVYAYCQKRKIKQFIDVVEWHQAHQYGEGVYNRIRFKLLDYTFTALSPKIHNIVAISTCIEQHFKKQSCNVMIIPPLTEEKKAVAEAKGTSALGKVNIIYPGIPFENTPTFVIDSTVTEIQTINVTILEVAFVTIQDFHSRNFLIASRVIHTIWILIRTFEEVDTNCRRL